MTKKEEEEEYIKKRRKEKEVWDERQENETEFADGEKRKRKAK